MKINNLSWDWDCDTATIEKEGIEAQDRMYIYTFDLNAYQRGSFTYELHTSPAEYNQLHISVDITNFVVQDKNYEIVELTENEIEKKIEEITKLIKTI